MHTVLSFLVYVIFLFTLCNVSCVHSTQYDLSICAIFQNEARFLKEWIDFHKKQGVQHFYLYNNLSTDEYLQVLKPYLENGDITLTKWSYHSHDEESWIPIHVSAFNHALSICDSKWLLGIDVDEFVFAIEKNNLIDFLKDYADYACVSACWVNYGTSNIYEVNSVTKELLYRAPIEYKNNLTVKSFVQCDKTSHFTTSHFGHAKYNHLQVNENKISFQGMIAPYFTVNKIRINHYWVRDEKYLYEVKIPRMKKWGRSTSRFIFNELNQVYDPILSN